MIEINARFTKDPGYGDFLQLALRVNLRGKTYHISRSYHQDEFLVESYYDRVMSQVTEMLKHHLLKESSDEYVDRGSPGE